MNGQTVGIDDLKELDDFDFSLYVVWPTEADGWTVVEGDFWGGWSVNDTLAGILSRGTGSVSLYGYDNDGNGVTGWVVFRQGEEELRRDPELAEASGYRFTPDRDLPEAARSVRATFAARGRTYDHQPFHLTGFAGHDVEIFVLSKDDRW
jgi:hypothetical protein